MYVNCLIYYYLIIPNYRNVYTLTALIIYYSGKMKAEDRIGKKYGYLTVVGIIREGKYIYVDCVCDCGNRHRVMINNISRNTISCGCKKIERIRKIGYAKKTHGCSHYHVTKEYGSWQGMKSRCNNPNDPEYKNYGGRGILVCDRWSNSFETFLSDMGERPENKTLDRIDPNGNYTPENCKWSSPKEQLRNTRFNKLINFRGRLITIPELSELCGIKIGTLRQRIFKYNWTVEKAATTPTINKISWKKD
jgi:hypothetical protein